MYDFVIQIALVVSLGIVIYLLAKAMPRISDSATTASYNKIDQLLAKVPLAKIDAALNSFFEKLLRKFKVVVLKVDNLINMYINRLRRNGKPKQ